MTRQPTTSGPPLFPGSSTTTTSITQTPAAKTRTPALTNRQFTPRKRPHYTTTPPTPLLTPCPHPSPTSLPPPYIPPLTTAASLQAERESLLTALQVEDFNTSCELGMIHVLTSRLDNSIPLPPHEVRNARRALRLARTKVEACMGRERWMLGRLGEIAFLLQQIERWERITWAQHHGAGVGEQAEMGFGGPVVGYQPLHGMYEYGAQADSAYGFPSTASPPSPVIKEPEVFVPAGPIRCWFAPHPQEYHWHQEHTFDTTSGVTSAATTRRNTLGFPPDTPFNSRQGSVSAQGHGVSGLGLGKRMAQLAGGVDGYLPAQTMGRDAIYRRSEPGLVVGKWSGDGEEMGGFVGDEGRGSGADEPVGTPESMRK